MEMCPGVSDSHFCQGKYPRPTEIVWKTTKHPKRHVSFLEIH